MNTKIFRLLGTLILMATSAQYDAQCEIKSKIASDGNLYYYLGPEQFYWSSAKKLRGGIFTDKEYFYLVLWPQPFPEKPAAQKLKENMQVKLANDSLYQLEYYYSDYDQGDTSLQLMYLIDKKDVKAFTRSEINQVMISLGDSSGVRTYNLKLHKDALQIQMNCFLEEKKKKPKKE
ncbi:MAG: hypothetical protein PSX36_02670 [bacterium]|nr:hypothetical protein [bacterium]